jgi:5-methyltetrahydropteroyltriglutamate--homocysteine methyltransferase
MESRTKPPFRADQVGSLLRPIEVVDARRQFAEAKIDAATLRNIEDDAIRRLVRRQEDVGLQAVTDGELRRGSWHMDFLCNIGGVVAGGTQLRPFKNESGPVRNEITLPKVVDRLHLEAPIFGKDFEFLKSVTKAVPKLTIPSPSMLHGLGASFDSSGAYDSQEAFLADLVKVYALQIRLLADIGCTYLQIDDTMLATLGDPAFRDQIRAQDGTLDQRHLTYIKLINDALATRPSNMNVCVHTCRGNHRSAWVASGGYDNVAEALFTQLNVDGFFLEYDDDRSGTFEPLRFVPKGKMVVLGLVTSKRPELESKDKLKQRIDEASKYIDLDQVALSPQCGFASTMQGNLLTEDQEFAKLRLVVETANEVWGTA